MGVRGSSYVVNQGSQMNQHHDHVGDSGCTPPGPTSASSSSSSLHSATGVSGGRQLKQPHSQTTSMMNMTVSTDANTSTVTLSSGSQLGARERSGQSTNTNPSTSGLPLSCVASSTVDDVGHQTQRTKNKETQETSRSPEKENKSYSASYACYVCHGGVWFYCRDQLISPTSVSEVLCQRDKVVALGYLHSTCGL